MERLNIEERLAVQKLQHALQCEALVVITFRADGDNLTWKVGSSASPGTEAVTHEMSDRCVRWLRALAVKS